MDQQAGMTVFSRLPSSFSFLMTVVLSFSLGSRSLITIGAIPVSIFMRLCDRCGSAPRDPPASSAR
jgi:hypothetical protein